MSQLNKAALETKYNDSGSGLYKAGQVDAIGSDDHRSLVTDLKDSLLFISDHLLDEDDMASDSATQVPSQQSVKAYIDSVVLGLWDDRGNYDASVNTFPASGGSGAAGAILKGDIWTASVAGTLGGEAVAIGDTIRAIADTPGQTASNWAIGEGNIDYVPEDQANKATDFSTVNNTLYPTVQAVVNYAMQHVMTTVGDLVRGGTAGAPTRIAAGTDGYVLTMVSGVPAWAAPAGGGSSVFSDLTDASGTNTVDNTNYTQTWTWNTLAGASGLILSSTSTAAASNLQTLLEVNMSGANANSTQTTYAARFINTHTGTASTNVAGYFSASGGTNNYGLWVNAGNISINDPSPTSTTRFSMRGTGTGANRNLELKNSSGSTTFYVQDNGTVSGGTFVGNFLTQSSQGFSSTATNYSGATSYFVYDISATTMNTVSGTQSIFGYRDNLNSNNSITTFNRYGFYFSPNVQSTTNRVWGFTYNPTVTGSLTEELAFYAVRGSSLFADGTGGSLTTNALLDLQSTTKAFIPPRMTVAQRDAIGSPSGGMIIYNNERNRLNIYNGSSWTNPVSGVTNAADDSETYDHDWYSGSVVNSGTATVGYNVFLSEAATTLEDRTAIVTYKILLTKSDGSDGAIFQYVVAYRKDGAADPVQVGSAVETLKVGNATPTIGFSISSSIPQVTVNDNTSGGWKVKIFANITISN